METSQFYLLLGLLAIVIALCAFILLKLKSVHYLLEQPVVKKMSPQLKLKPVKIEDSEEDTRRNNQVRNAAAPPANRNGRPMDRADQGPDRGNRDFRDRQPRPDRGPERERSDRPEGGGDRGPRNDRDNNRDRFRDRDRNPRNDRDNRHGGGGDRNRGREPFSNDRDVLQKEQAPGGDAPQSFSPPSYSRPAPVAAAPAAENPAPSSPPFQTLAPRRPLHSTPVSETQNHGSSPLDVQPSQAQLDDALFNRDDSDIQHGRRNQLKKKPRFDMAPEEAPAPTEEAKI